MLSTVTDANAIACCLFHFPNRVARRECSSFLLISQYSILLTGCRRVDPTFFLSSANVGDGIVFSLYGSCPRRFRSCGSAIMRCLMEEDKVEEENKDAGRRKRWCHQHSSNLGIPQWHVM